MDRSLGQRSVVDALRSAGFPVIGHDEKFAQNTEDEIWLAEVGQAGWIALSGDKSIRRKRNELDAYKRNRVRAVFLTSGNLTGQQQADVFVRNGRKIQDHAMSASAPAAFSLSKSGELKPIRL